jgi:hypothetical protein
MKERFIHAARLRFLSVWAVVLLSESSAPSDDAVAIAAPKATQRYETHRYRAPQLFLAQWASDRVTPAQRRFFAAHDALRVKQASGEITHRERVTESLRRAGFDVPKPCWADISPFDSHLWITAPPSTLAELERRLRIKPVIPNPKPLL